MTEPLTKELQTEATGLHAVVTPAIPAWPGRAETAVIVVAALYFSMHQIEPPCLTQGVTESPVKGLIFIAIFICTHI